jgi:hypothetical protein
VTAAEIGLGLLYIILIFRPRKTSQSRPTNGKREACFDDDRRYKSVATVTTIAVPSVQEERMEVQRRLVSPV